ncbi:hypothetical protein BG53_10100 [Paenibacillus darwinianus]|uniref:Uncharacterized protein n=2 Tax=Paenibacillus darwinianus TaxID=1380763 RepID=A0A9W5W6H9_9BACL|nr:hypothetical protein [Paenibacillus darwinianus]EXX84914.1 hypothetical protein BG53_10100 [Paenibacillus darwinianus]EXX84947.1 hypothetical protein BG52_09570 [Paenibacillus darwinianus]
MRRWLPFFAALILLLCAAPSLYDDTASASGNNVPVDLDAQIDVWAAGLSKQPGFKMLPEAERRISALGPGTRGWLVTFHGVQGTFAYMIVHAIETGGYRLTEYGAGDGRPFSPAVLQRGLANLEAPLDGAKKPFRTERLYVNSMLAAWRVSVPGQDPPAVYVDAYNGEELPVTDEEWQAAALEAEKAAARTTPADPAGRTAQKAVVQALRTSPFNPYEHMPWLTKKPLDVNSRSGEKLLLGKLEKRAQLRLTAEKFNGEWLSVLPVTGLHIWDNGDSYVAVDEHGTRYAPFRDILLYTRIYD